MIECVECGARYGLENGGSLITWVDFRGWVCSTCLEKSRQQEDEAYRRCQIAECGEQAFKAWFKRVYKAELCVNSTEALQTIEMLLPAFLQCLRTYAENLGLSWEDALESADDFNERHIRRTQ